MEKKIKITILSEQTEISKKLIEKLLETDIEDFSEDGQDDSSAEKNNTDKLKLRTEGTLKIKDGRAEISYEESEITGMEGSVTKLSFSINDPTIITLLREGAVSTAMVFEAGKRHICVYETGIMPFELCIDTIHVNNEILTCGSIYLDYILEIKGGEAGRTRFTMKIDDVNEITAKPLDEYNE